MRGFIFSAILSSALAFGYLLGQVTWGPASLDADLTEVVVLPPDTIEVSDTPCNPARESVCQRFNVSCGTVTIRVCGEISTFHCGTCGLDSTCVNDRHGQFCVRQM